MDLIKPRHPVNPVKYRAYTKASNISKFLIKAEATGTLVPTLAYLQQAIYKYDLELVPEATQLCKAISDYYIDVGRTRTDDLDYITKGLYDSLTTPVTLDELKLIPEFFLGFGASKEEGTFIENYGKYSAVADALHNFLAAQWDDD
jgi:hypothetical protein